MSECWDIFWMPLLEFGLPRVLSQQTHLDLRRYNWCSFFFRSAKLAAIKVTMPLLMMIVCINSVKGCQLVRELLCLSLCAYSLKWVLLYHLCSYTTFGWTLIQLIRCFFQLSLSFYLHFIFNLYSIEFISCHCIIIIVSLVFQSFIVWVFIWCWQQHKIYLCWFGGIYNAGGLF